MPPIPGLAENKNCIDSTGALTLEQMPASMVIIGGGVIGIELACTYALFGTKVTVVEMMPRLMPVMDYELTQMAQKIMEDAGIEFLLETQVLGFEAGDVGAKVVIKDKSGAESKLEAEKVLVAVGRRSNVATLNLGAAGIVTERGHVVTNDHIMCRECMRSVTVLAGSCWPTRRPRWAKSPLKTPWEAPRPMTKGCALPAFIWFRNLPMWA